MYTCFEQLFIVKVSIDWKEIYEVDRLKGEDKPLPAFNGKSSAAAVAAASINIQYLDTLLYVWCHS